MSTPQYSDPQLSSAMAALAALYNFPSKRSENKTPAKKKRRKSVAKSARKRKNSRAVPEPDDDEFEYNWPTCACGMDHPPVPDFDPPDRMRCTYYWQIADMFPYLTLYRALTTEIKFKQADTDQSGVIELDELNALLSNIVGSEVNDKLIESTFKEIDTDESGTLDFVEVLTIVNKLVQRQQTDIPVEMKNQYSKVCSIQ